MINTAAMLAPAVVASIPSLGFDSSVDANDSEQQITRQSSSLTLSQPSIIGSTSFDPSHAMAFLNTDSGTKILFPNQQAGEHHLCDLDYGSLVLSSCEPAFDFPSGNSNYYNVSVWPLDMSGSRNLITKKLASTGVTSWSIFAQGSLTDIPEPYSLYASNNWIGPIVGNDYLIATLTRYNSTNSIYLRAFDTEFSPRSPEIELYSSTQKGGAQVAIMDDHFLAARSSSLNRVVFRYVVERRNAYSGELIGDQPVNSKVINLYTPYDIFPHPFEYANPRQIIYSDQRFKMAHYLYHTVDIPEIVSIQVYNELLDDQGKSILPANFLGTMWSYETINQTMEIHGATIFPFSRYSFGPSYSKLFYFFILDPAGKEASANRLALRNEPALANAIEINYQLSDSQIIASYSEPNQSGGFNMATLAINLNLFTPGATATFDQTFIVQDAENSPINLLSADNFNLNSQNDAWHCLFTPDTDLLSFNPVPSNLTTHRSASGHYYALGQQTDLQALFSEWEAGTLWTLPEETPGLNPPAQINIEILCQDGGSTLEETFTWEMRWVNDQPTLDSLPGLIPITENNELPFDMTTLGRDAETATADLTRIVRTNGNSNQACVMAAEDDTRTCLANGSTLSNSQAYVLRALNDFNGLASPIVTEICDEEGSCVEATFPVEVIEAVSDITLASALPSLRLQSGQAINQTLNLRAFFNDPDNGLLDFRFTEQPAGLEVTVEHQSDPTDPEAMYPLTISAPTGFNTTGSFPFEVRHLIEIDQFGLTPIDEGMFSGSLSIQDSRNITQIDNIISESKGNGNDWLPAVIGGGAAALLVAAGIGGHRYRQNKRFEKMLMSTTQTRQAHNDTIPRLIVEYFELFDYYDFSSGLGANFLSTYHSKLSPIFSKYFGDLAGKVPAELTLIAQSIIHAIESLIASKHMKQKGHHIALDQFILNAETIGQQALSFYKTGDIEAQRTSSKISTFFPTQADQAGSQMMSRLTNASRGSELQALGTETPPPGVNHATFG